MARFSGFPTGRQAGRKGKTVELKRLAGRSAPSTTQLKLGVNEKTSELD